MGPVTWATGKFIQRPGRLNAQLKCECIPFRPGIIELTIEIGAHGAGKKLAGSARAL
jgi:hypothetical protein